jgi:hypothetical protein
MSNFTVSVSAPSGSSVSMSHAGDWSSYLNERGIANDPRLDKSFNWSRNEMIADDHRILFGTSAAASEMAYVNPDVYRSTQPPRAQGLVHQRLGRA